MRYCNRRISGLHANRSTDRHADHGTAGRAGQHHFASGRSRVAAYRGRAACATPRPHGNGIAPQRECNGLDCRWTGLPLLAGIRGSGMVRDSRQRSVASAHAAAKYDDLRGKYRKHPRPRCHARGVFTLRIIPVLHDRNIPWRGLLHDRSIAHRRGSCGIR